jgi:hypothetical protein
MVRWHGHGCHWILAAYLLVYAVAIVLSVVITRNMAGALVHLGLLVSGALVLQTILTRR